MSTYHFTWNPKRWAWDDLAEMALATSQGKPVETGGKQKAYETGIDRAINV
jgi:hypothetical protein